MAPNEHKKLVLLAVLDGWGIAPPGQGNSISLAQTPEMKRLWAQYPHTQLGASGDSVGLPRGEVGNTETGHLNLGAGRIVYQDLARINMAIADGSFFNNQAILSAFEHAKKNNSKLHFMGLVGAGGVHSNIEHLFALLQLAARTNQKVFIHVFTDGRDSPTNASATYIKQVDEVINKGGVGQIASIMGRYWAMDRDMRWDRTAKAYLALTQGKGHLVKSPYEAIELSYSQGKTDEFLEPALISDSSGAPVALIEDNDAVIFFNFRIDRPRQLSRAFVLKDFSKAATTFVADENIPESKKAALSQTPLFDRGKALNLYFVTMTEYEELLTNDGAKAAFPPEILGVSLGSVISSHGLKQLRIAESEKERFVTIYFNGMRESAFEGEERLIIPSPKVATYDLKPEMSAIEITDALISRIQSDQYSFILVNYANPDMVGHTGNIEAATKAIEVVDSCIGKVVNQVVAIGGTAIVTADHGNSEDMKNHKTGDIDTEHSKNPVPFIAASNVLSGRPQMLQSGILADIAPTILNLLGLGVPSEMMGRNLLSEL